MISHSFVFVLILYVHIQNLLDLEKGCCKVESFRSQVSSGSIVSDYGLDDRAIGARSLAGAKDFSSSLCVQTGSGAHPASCTMGTGGKARPGRDADRSPLSSAQVVNE
jgi:hypothetical protein